MTFKVITDGSCDLDDNLVLKHNIDVVPFYVSFDDYNFKKEKEEISVLDFYQKMVDHPDVYPKTSMPTSDDFYRAFEKYAKENIDIICICITTKFSGSYNAALVAKTEILKHYDVNVEIVDAMMNTCIQGILVLETARMSENNVEFEDAVKYVTEIKNTGRIFFTTGNLEYLKHGGRIGKLKGLLASAFKIRPLIILKEGEIFSLGITFTKKQAMVKVIDHLQTYINDNNINPNDYIFIAGCGINHDDLDYFIEIFERKIPNVPIMRGQIGATIGVHTGPYPLGIGLIKKYDA